MDQARLLHYEDDPQLYLFLEKLQQDHGNIDGWNVILAPPPGYVRPRYYDRRPDNSLAWKRYEQKLTQGQLATLSGTSRRTIGAIENKRREPSVYLALTLAEALGLKVEDIFYLEPLTTVPPSRH